MARTPSLSPEECQQALGVAPFNGMSGGFTVTADNRGMVQKWLSAMGIPSRVAKGMSLDTLAKCYTIRAYFDTVRARHANDAPEAESDEEAVEVPAVASRAPVAPVLDMEAGLAALRTLLGGAGLSEARVVELIGQHAFPVTRIEIKSTDDFIRVLPDKPRHPVFAEVLQWCGAGVHVALVGPAGSGKSTIGEQVAEALARTYYLGGAVYSEFQLTGYRDANGTYRDTAFRRAFEQGGVYVQEEADASDPRAMVWVNAALANGHADFPDGRVKAHADFVCLVCMNTYGTGASREYVGRNPLDAATLDRFAFVTVEYDEPLERAIAGNDDWVSYVQSVRKVVVAQKLRHIVSPRASIYGARALASGIPQRKVEAALLWKGLDAEKVRQIKAAL